MIDASCEIIWIICRLHLFRKSRLTFAAKAARHALQNSTCGRTFGTLRIKKVSQFHRESMFVTGDQKLVQPLKALLGILLYHGI